MLNEPFVTLAKTAAKALRTHADDLERCQEPGQLAHVAGYVDEVGFRLMGIAHEAKNASYKG